jgi:hypothetical protein
MLVALGIMAAALYLIVERVFVAGSVAFAVGLLATWATGIWVLPGSTDAYRRRLQQTMREGAIVAARVSSGRGTELRESTSRIEGLGERCGAGGDFSGLMSECARVDEELSSPTAVFADIAFDLAVHYQRLLRMVDEANKNLDGQLGDALKRRAQLLAENAIERNAAVGEQLSRYEHMSVPSSLCDSHSEFLEALGAYRAALQNFTGAFTVAEAPALCGYLVPVGRDWQAVMVATGRLTRAADGVVA